jgi:hypothetical protein
MFYVLGPINHLPVIQYNTKQYNAIQYNTTLGDHGGGHHVVPQPNTAFKTFIIQYFTYAIAMYLKLFKTHHALGRGVI